MLFFCSFVLGPLFSGRIFLFLFNLKFILFNLCHDQAAARGQAEHVELGAGEQRGHVLTPPSAHQRPAAFPGALPHQPPPEGQ
jgi:hypothetical protein